MNSEEKDALEAYLEDRPWRPSEARVTRAVVKILIKLALGKEKPKAPPKMSTKKDGVDK